MLLLSICSLAAAGCGDGSPPALTVGPVSFSRDQLLGLPDARRQSLGELAAFGLAVSDSSVEALGEPLLRVRRDDVLLDVLAAELLLEERGVDDAVLEARYLTAPDYELTVRHVLFFSERWRNDDHRAAAREKAERALRQLQGGADFAETAATLSEEPGAEGRQGLLTPGREGSWVPEFWRAALALEVGEMSPVTETQYGYHILRLEGREVVPFAEARSRIVREVARQVGDPKARLEAWTAAARTGIVVDEDALAKYGTDVAPDGSGSAEATGAAEDPATVLARWDTGSLTAGDFAEWAASRPAVRSGVGTGAHAERVRQSVSDLAARRAALDEARRRGLSVPAAEADSILRAWTDRTIRWATALGFVRGTPPDGMDEAALEALSRSAQGATIARNELSEHAPLLHAAYEIRLAPDGN